MADPYRVGLVYYSAGQRVQVEKGFQTVGYTTYDSKIGQHVYWFPSIAEFEKNKRDIFESTMGHNRPVPIVEMLTPPPVVEVEVAGAEGNAPTNLDESEVKAATEAKLLPEKLKITPEQEADLIEHAGSRATIVRATPIIEDVAIAPPPPLPKLEEAKLATDVVNTLAEDIYTAHAGRKIRLNDFAVELGLDADIVRKVVQSDPRYAPIVAGWVRLAGDTSQIVP